MKPWFQRIPHPVMMLFMIMVLTAFLTYLLPAGLFERELVEGRQRVIPGSYHTVPSSPVNLMDLFTALPAGFEAASQIIFVVLASGIMFGVLEASGAIEQAVGSAIHRLGARHSKLAVVIMTFLFGMLGVFVGYENNIAMVPIAAVVSLALGGDLMLAAGIAVGGITVGFGLSPVNPYTVGVGHKIAEMPLFSGILLRSILCGSALAILSIYNLRYFQHIRKDKDHSLTKDLDTDGLRLSKPLQDYSLSTQDTLVLSSFIIGLGTMLWGIFQHGWYINEISAIFIMVAIAAGLVARMPVPAFCDTVLKSVAVVAPGAFMVGLANSIRVIMERGQIVDTISFHLSEGLGIFPTYASALFMTLAQSIINLLIPSGSGQALATLPIMIPVGESLELTRQSTILAFQIGDGVTNLVNPAMGGLIAMLAMSRVPFDRWLRFIAPLTGIILLLAWAFLLFSIAIKWGPV